MAVRDNQVESRLNKTWHVAVFKNKNIVKMMLIRTGIMCVGNYNVV